MIRVKDGLHPGVPLVQFRHGGKQGRRLNFDQKGAAMRFLTREEADIAHANGAFIPGAETFVPRWQAKAAAFRDACGPRARLDLPYGSGARHAFDLFLPEGDAKGLLVFVHGGYWVASDRAEWSHLAAGPLAHGYAVAVPSYTLCPETRVSAITREIAAAIEACLNARAGGAVTGVGDGPSESLWQRASRLEALRA